MRKRWYLGGVAAASLLAVSSASAQVCVGSCGTLGADGVVTTSPEGGTYQFVSTSGGVFGVGSLPGVGGDGSPTDGSTFTTALFGADADDVLAFYFNYVTSDGAEFVDYAWARLLNSDLSEAALLFTARTTPGGNTVPGFGMPAPTATLDPSFVTIKAGTTWSALGGDSGSCWDVGCGHTEWVFSQFTIGTAGNYFLQFGVTNWNDTLFDTGMAFDGATIQGVPIPGGGGSVVPEPMTMILMGTGLTGLAAARRRRKFQIETA